MMLEAGWVIQPDRLGGGVRAFRDLDQQVALGQEGIDAVRISFQAM